MEVHLAHQRLEADHSEPARASPGDPPDGNLAAALMPFWSGIRMW